MEIVSNKKQFLPYIGPRPFQNNSHDRAVFYGRDYESQEIISLILANPIVLVYSQSGSGKTSLFNAKIYPTLAEQYDFQIFPTALVRGAIPEDLDIDKIPNLYIFNILQSLNPKSSDINANSMTLQIQDLVSFLKQYPSVSPDTDNNKDQDEPNLKLIVFDQFEDFFNIFPPNDWQKQQNDFFIQIIKALENDPSLRIVFVMREEYVAHLDPFAYNLSGKLRARFRLEPLRRVAALLAVTQPLKNTGVSFAPGVAEELVDNLTKIHVEDVFHKPTITKGEYVEPVHLQVVCQRLWNKVVSQKLTQITLNQLEDVDAALKEFYEEAVRDTVKQTGIKENVIRDWCEDKLITTTGTRSTIHQVYDSTGGLSNEAVSVLASKHLIREESRSGATWIELTHDRLIEPIKEANKKWHDEQNKSKRSFRMRVFLPVAVIAIIGISLLVSFSYNQISQQYLKVISQQNKVISQLCGNGQPVPLVGSSSAVDSNLQTNKIYVTGADSNKLFVIDGNTCTVSSLQVGKNPLAVAVDSKLNKVYVANNDSNTISIIDGQSNSETSDPVPVGRGPDAVAVDLNTSKAYVANSKDNTISLIDGRTDTILGKPILVGLYPQAIAIDPNTHKVYVANKNNNTVSVIDGLTSTVVGKPISVGRGPAFVVIDPNMQKVYVASIKGKSVSVIDIKTDKVVDTIRVGRGLSGLTVDTKTHKVYVSDSHPNSIYIIDGKYNTVSNISPLNNTAGIIFFNPYTNLIYHVSGNGLSMINAAALNKERDIIPVGMSPLDVKFDQKTNKLYVTNFRSFHDQPLGTVSVIDLKTDKVVGNIEVGMGPDGIAIDPTTNKAYVSNFANNTISVIDLKRNAVIGKPIQVGSGPSGIAIDLNARKVYVPNHDNDTVTVIDLNTNKVVATISVDRGPYAVAVNPNTGKVYVTNAKGGTLSVIDGRTKTHVGMIPVDTAPEAVAVDPTGGKAYVANFLDDTVSVIDLKANKVLKKIYLEDGSSPDAITIAAGKAYISNSKTDTVTVIDLKTDKLVYNIKVGSNPEAVAVDPGAGKAYVANYKDNTVSIIKLYGTN